MSSKVNGLDAGTHTVRFTLTSGAGFNLRALLVPNPTPPTVVWLEEGLTSTSGANTFMRDGTTLRDLPATTQCRRPSSPAFRLS